ncbi:OLC1v1024418C1 [Oldenlandia corymbosa var. corymbosa]|uniref:Glycosyltransferase n=1 Tax=Oldenlandia corymbosa var. corymbosa TaxID=529605 RepID=A0AAV1C430_OLDCO|nr:OLC1v1024418C1 [Oldenlandia corymbosa var. corymbosa]
MAERKKLELVFIPSPGVGHIFSAIEVSKFLIHQNQNLSISILVMKLPSDTKPMSESPHPRITFAELRKGEYDPSTSAIQGSSPFLFFFRLIEMHRAHVREILTEKTGSGSSTRVAGIIIDMFCTSMIDVANEFRIPPYIFFPSGAAMIGLMLCLQSLRDDSSVDVSKYKDSDEKVAIPTYSDPVPAKLLPSILYDDNGGCKAFLDQAKRFREAKGILLNTFKEMESHALKALSDDPTVPPIYAIGPIVKMDAVVTDPKSEALLKWLDRQPESSVVFLCFGSMGSFSEDQVKEIARALENTGCRFIWSLRKPQPKGRYEPPSDYENPGEVLPEGFLERTAEVGKVIGWAPQAAILCHPAVGGFVTHCGWNSVLESVCNGVPMAVWPLYAEQQVNAFLLVKDSGLAVEIKMDYRKEVMRTEGVEIVSADVIENGLKKLMDHESEVRKKAKEMKEKSRLALTEGGSSYASLNSFLNIVADD